MLLILGLIVEWVFLQEQHAVGHTKLAQLQLVSLRNVLVQNMQFRQCDQALGTTNAADPHQALVLVVVLDVQARVAVKHVAAQRVAPHLSLQLSIGHFRISADEDEV